MRIKPFASLAGALTAGALILSACGGDEAAPNPAADAVPADDMRVLERRVGGLERQLRELRQEIRSPGDDEQSSSDEPGDAAATGGPADQGGASTPEAAAGGTRGASDSDSGTSSGDSSGGGRPSGGPPSGGGASPPGGGGGSDVGAGPDPGTSEDDRSLEDICGPNPAPEC